MYDKSFGQRLAELRDEHGYSQEAVAERLGLSKSSLSEYETNSREPDFEMLKKIADLYQVSIDYLFHRTDHRGTLLQSADAGNPSDLEQIVLILRSRVEKHDLSLDNRPLNDFEVRMLLAPFDALLGVIKTIRDNTDPFH